MKILHTEWSDGLGGQEKRVLAECRGLAERGHEIELACREHSGIRSEAGKLGIKVHILPLRRPSDAASILSLYRIIKRGRFDVVNTHSGVDSWIGGIAARLAAVPLLARTRHLNIPLKRNILNFVHYLPDLYITCGEHMRRNLIDNCGFPGDKVVSIPTGVSSEFFNVRHDATLKQKYGLKDDAVVITNVGILRSVKGHEVTLRAVRKVVRACPNATFLLAGDGPREMELKKMIRELDISRHVIMTGFVNNIVQIYSISNIAILSSWSEGLPQSILQAMAAGVPVVATRVGGVPEVVMDGETGILVDPGDHDALAEGIVKIINDNKLSQRFTEKAKEKVRAGHSVSHMVDKTELLYKALLSRR